MDRRHAAAALALALAMLTAGAHARRDCSRYFFKTNVPRVLLHAGSGMCYWDHDVAFKYPKECTALGATTIPAFALNGQPLTTQQALASLLRGHDRAACCPDAVAYMRSKPPGVPAYQDIWMTPQFINVPEHWEWYLDGLTKLWHDNVHRFATVGEACRLPTEGGSLIEDLYQVMVNDDDGLPDSVAQHMGL